MNNSTSPQLQRPPQDAALERGPDGGTAAAGVVAINRISAPKAADVLADELRRRIRSGEWPEGLALPTERDLSTQAGLSRTTVREALRMLERDGLIEIRLGRSGGARVRRPAGDGLSRHLELFIWGRNISVEHLHDVRSALEALGAEGAARHRTPAEVAELVARTEAVEAAVGNVAEYLDANLAWHMAVVRASHNELLVSFMEVLSAAIHQATEIEAFDSEEVRASTLKIHRAILDAIVAGDAEAARRRMARHVHAARDVALDFESGGAAKRGAAGRARLERPVLSPATRAAGVAPARDRQPRKQAWPGRKSR
ncbi:MAG TPA: FadR/GntR family transcriptional regulator [Burkholderiaceae bacterium]